MMQDISNAVSSAQVVVKKAEPIPIANVSYPPEMLLNEEILGMICSVYIQLIA